MKRAIVLAAALLAAVAVTAQDLPNGRFTKLAGMQLPGMVTREANGIPHVFAFNKHDLYFLNGWLHANDRLWQMDNSRRIAAGTLSELVGSGGLSTDVQLRTLGLYRAAEATLPLLSPEAQAALQAYADGVNAWLATHPTLPPEYGLLEISKVAKWTPVDSIAVGKLIAFGLSFDLDDISRTVALLTYQGTGKAAGFDGTKLFFETWRSAPFSNASTIPDATGAGAALPATIAPPAREIDTSWVAPQTIELLRKYRDEVARVEVMAHMLDPDDHAASNEWAIAPRNSASGHALIANDPHLSLSSPPNFYPISLRAGKTSVNGMGFPGAPGVIQGQNQRIAWGSTVHPMDVTDAYQEQLVPDAASPSGFSSLYKGAKEIVVPIPQVFRMNVAGDGVRDNLVTVPASATIPAATLVVPRHGPIVQIDTKGGIAVSVQYVGFYPTHEIEAFMAIDDAQNVDEFKAALQLFDVGSQNFAYADVDGNIAYFTGGEMPVREDLQALKVAGSPPFFIRNGQGGNEWMAVTNKQPNQAVPFEILPYAEMPQVVNPSNGWFVNANNDPIGQTLDNDPLNTLRPGGGLLYLSPGYDGIRAGRITELIRQKLSGGGKISVDDMKNIQADTALLDAEVFVPYLVAAMNGTTSHAQLTALRSDPTLIEAVNRLKKWNFTTPTGIAAGYDAAETDGQLTTPTQAEIDNSVAATIYAAWRSQILRNTIDGTLNAASVPLPPSQQALAALRFQLDHFDQTSGVGAAGLSFFSGPIVPAASPQVRRDFILLQSLSDALAMLRNDNFAPAFAKSTNLDDYRWGKLHRVVFAHTIGPLFSPGDISGPPPFSSVPGLRGVSTDGGYSTVDAATHNARASTPDGFMFTSGPNRRYVGEMLDTGPSGQSSLPGGVSGISTSPFFTNLLMLWLTNDTFAVKTDASPRIPFIP